MVKIIILFIIYNYLPFLVLTMEGQTCIINTIKERIGNENEDYFNWARSNLVFVAK